MANRYAKVRGRVLYSDDMKKGIVQLVSELSAKGTPWLKILSSVRKAYPTYVGGIDALKQIYNRCKGSYTNPKSIPHVRNVSIQVEKSTLSQQLADALEPIIQKKADEKALTMLKETMEFIQKKIQETSVS